jgi:hypothetical protein
MPESRIVWLRDPSAFPWVRVVTVYAPSRTGWKKSWFSNGHIVGYAELSPDAPSSNRRVSRRCFYVRDTDYPFGEDYRPAAPYKPGEAVDPLTIIPNGRGELTARSRSAEADLALIHEERRSDVAYEILQGKPRLVLSRPTEHSPTERCHFCGRKHMHGIGDGAREEHCVGNRMKNEVVALDGTRLRRGDGYVVRTIEARGA